MAALVDQTVLCLQRHYPNLFEDVQFGYIGKSKEELVFLAFTSQIQRTFHSPLLPIPVIFEPLGIQRSSGIGASRIRITHKERDLWQAIFDAVIPDLIRGHTNVTAAILGHPSTAGSLIPSEVAIIIAVLYKGIIPLEEEKFPSAIQIPSPFMVADDDASKSRKMRVDIVTGRCIHGAGMRKSDCTENRFVDTRLMPGHCIGFISAKQCHTCGLLFQRTTSGGRVEHFALTTNHDDNNEEKSADETVVSPALNHAKNPDYPSDVRQIGKRIHGIQGEFLTKGNLSIGLNAALIQLIPTETESLNVPLVRMNTKTYKFTLFLSHAQLLTIEEKSPCYKIGARSGLTRGGMISIHVNVFGPPKGERATRHYYLNRSLQGWAAHDFSGQLLILSSDCGGMFLPGDSGAVAFYMLPCCDKSMGPLPIAALGLLHANLAMDGIIYELANPFFAVAEWINQRLGSFLFS